MVPDHWHPYTREVEVREGDGATVVVFRQGRLVAVAADGTPTTAIRRRRACCSRRARRCTRSRRWRLPPTGVRLERRRILARTTTGRPVLWVQRQRAPLLAMPSSGLCFDVLTPAPPQA